MAVLYALTKDPLPAAIHGTDGDFSIRTLADRERILIEDYFPRKEIKVALAHDATAVVVPQIQLANSVMDDVAVLVEFALGVLSTSGFSPITTVAVLNASTCGDALRRPCQEDTNLPRFPRKLVKAAASTWINHVFTVRQKIKGNLHITADRFVRYLKMNNTRDALVDLCICLESLIESSTEISFRFAVCLAKVSSKNAEPISDLLSDLYDLRSKVVHGTDFTKEHKKVLPHTDKLRLASRAILTEYVLYMTAHTKEDWKRYLRSSLLK
jgi:hypothetical protein